MRPVLHTLLRAFLRRRRCVVRDLCRLSRESHVGVGGFLVNGLVRRRGHKLKIVHSFRHYHAVLHATLHATCAIQAILFRHSLPCRTMAGLGMRTLII